jgi:hypothetical protein
LRGGLEHLKMKTRLIDGRFASVMGECVIVTLYYWGASMFKVIRSAAVSARILPILCLYTKDLLWIDKARAKDKTYICMSVWWKTKN